MRIGWLAAALLVLTACGGGSSDPDTEPAPDAASTSATSTQTEAAESPSDEAALEQAYRVYTEAFLTGDGATAYALLSERCRDGHALSEFAAIAESAAEIYGEVDYTLNEVTVDGDKGSVDATYAVEALNGGGGSLWVREGGEWHSDKCD